MWRGGRRQKLSAASLLLRSLSYLFGGGGVACVQRRAPASATGGRGERGEGGSHSTTASDATSVGKKESDILGREDATKDVCVCVCMCVYVCVRVCVSVCVFMCSDTPLRVCSWSRRGERRANGYSDLTHRLRPSPAVDCSVMQQRSLAQRIASLADTQKKREGERAP